MITASYCGNHKRSCTNKNKLQPSVRMPSASGIGPPCKMRVCKSWTLIRISIPAGSAARQIKDLLYIATNEKLSRALSHISSAVGKHLDVGGTATSIGNLCRPPYCPARSHTGWHRFASSRPRRTTNLKTVFQCVNICSTTKHH